MKTFKLLSLLLTLSTCVFAQIPYSMQYGSYTQDFNSLANSGTASNVLPVGWGLFETGSGANTDYGISTGTSTSGDTYSFGAATTTDRSLGGLQSSSVVPSYGFGFKNNTGYPLTYINLTATMEQWRVSNTPGFDSCYFYYSTNATSLGDLSATWVRVPALDLFSAVDPSSGSSLDGNLAVNRRPIAGVVTATIAVGDTLFFKWVDVNISGSDDGLSVDDVTLTLFGPTGPLPAGPPKLVAMWPMDNNLIVPYTTTTLSFTFSDTITTVGTGNILIKDLNNAANNVTIAATALVKNGSTFTYNALVLQPNTPYAVQIDSNTFYNDLIPFAGIYNDTSWNFSTISLPLIATGLQETFTACSNPFLGAFRAFSVVGTQDWRCTSAGHNDTNAVFISGLAPGPTDNEDWLISPPLDLSAMNAPHLHFWSKLRVAAASVKEIMVSSNYIGLGNPALATWTAIQINNFTSLDTIWRHFRNADLSQYNTSNFYVAFKYVSDTTNADEWIIDDVTITDGPLSVGTFDASNLTVKVVGAASSNLNLLSASSKNQTLDYTIMDMTGRAIYVGKLTIANGIQQHRLDISSLRGGMYLIQFNSQSEKKSIKFMVQ